MRAEELTRWSRRARHAAAVVVPVGALVLLVFSRSSAYGLFTDDYQWVIGAWHYNFRHSTTPRAGSFFRPVMDLYFFGAVTVCGWSAPCLHWLSIAAHFLTSLGVAALVTSLSGTRGTGLLAGVLFAAQPGPVGAVVWVSAVSEVLATLWAVLTLILFRHAHRNGRTWPRILSIVTFSAALFSHESGVIVLPLMIFMSWLLPPSSRPALPARIWAIYGVILAGYLGIALTGNASNPVVTSGEYQVGWHIARNVVHAVISMTAGARGTIGLALAAAALAWAVLLGPRLVRYFALWFVIALLPFSLFRDGLPSRYTYPAAVGLASLTAALAWWARTAIWHRRGVWRVGWWVVVLFVVARNAAFASRNARIGETDHVPYERYAALVRASYPNPEPGARLDVPPPASIDEMYVEPLLRWTYQDPTLTAQITRER